MKHHGHKNRPLCSVLDCLRVAKVPAKRATHCYRCAGMEGGPKGAESLTKTWRREYNRTVREILLVALAIWNEGF